MIAVTRLDGAELVVNGGHITTIERTPDTVIELTTGQRIMVRETVDQVVSRVVAYRQQIAAGVFRFISQYVEQAGPVSSGPKSRAFDERPSVEEAGE